MIATGSDHAGYGLRVALEQLLTEKGLEFSSYGAMSLDAYDYPDASDAVCKAVLNGAARFGMLICGTGIGVSIRANRYVGIRAALCTSVEMAELARAHNHANVLCMGARTTEEALAESILMAFLEGHEDHAPRHENRVAKLDGNLDTE